MAPSASSSSTANTTSVQVAVRIRPTNRHDEETIPTRFQRTIVHGTLQTSTVTIDPSNVPASSVTTAAASPSSSAANNPLAKKQTFTFDQVHAQDSTQHGVFSSTAAPLVARFLQGFNCTVLAYGQTSSGKTYTMTGVDLDADPSDPSTGMGIIPRSIATIFQAAEQLKRERGNAWNYSLKGSYIEIYNEDLIDLLGVEDSAGGRREVQIREDKDGNIIWGGLREVSVKSTPEVMTLIKQGSSLRRTNETDMNAQSSRSHAIFSLTLTQKKYTGATSLSPPPRASGRSSPMGTPSPSRLARPASVYASVGGASPGRVGSPTFGRPPTPSFAVAMGRAAGTRPASVMGLRPQSPDHHEEPDAGGAGSWVTVVSKFHFVDLAGSERLKRTAAQGERIKEGISINSGLLALGNVISALGDPSRARSLNPNASVHVPYRDSKLTRLLQDSLGGNAHTLMIACVSPAEWNAAETVNTLKYANRARNIKNRAEVKEKEEGWEDVEWLQGMVNKLRKEVKALKEGGATSSSNGVEGGDAPPSNAKMLSKYNELQGMHEELRMRYASANEELRKTKMELETRPVAEKQPSRKYEDIVAPVIEQYEKTIAAMEAELKLNRTALAHTNEMFEEQEAELENLKERHASSEAYNEELRARITRLVERESSTEVYVRDLESKLKSYAESSTTSSDSINDLTKELARHKESDQATARYIADLEARLSRSDSDVNSTRRMVESLESQLAQKAVAIERLEAKIDTLLSTKSGSSDEDIEAWKATLEERERKVAELERRLEEWEKVRLEVGEERERLGSVVGGVERQRRDLEDELKREEGGMTPQFYPYRAEIDGISVLGTDADQSFRVPSPSASLPVTPIRGGKLSLPPQLEEEERLVVIRPSSPTGSIRSVRSIGASAIKEQLSNLQETHSKALTDLSDVTVKYRDALQEISTLNSRLTEIKNQPESGSDGDSSMVPINRNSGYGPGVGPRRRMTRNSDVTLFNGLSSPPSVATNTLNGATRRLFFRHAASADSLHSRSQSQSQSQEFSSSPLGLRSVLPRDSYGSWSMSGGGERDSLLSPTLTPKSPRMSLTFPGEGQRSVDSYEKEILRLQEVLKDRESEITLLENNLDLKSAAPRKRSVSPNAQFDELSTDVLDLNGGPHLNGTSVTPALSRKNSADERLSPKTRGRFAQLRQSLEISREPGVQEEETGGEGTLTRLNELMRSMAQKESSHKVVVDELNEQLETIKKEHDELTALSRDQARTMSTEMESLRLELHKSQEERTVYSTKLNELKSLETQLVEARRAVDSAHSAEIEKILQERDEELAKLRKEQEDFAARTADEHEDAVQYAIAKTRREAEVAAHSKLEAAKAEHEEAQTKLRQEHEDELRKHEFEVESLIARTRADHERLITRLRAEQEEAIKVKEAQILQSSGAAAEIKEKEVREALEVAHADSIKSMKEEHAKEIADRTAESDARLADIRKQHSADVEKVKADHAEVLTRLREESAEALKKARDEHDTTLAKAKSEYEAALAKKDAEHQLQMEREAEEHAAELRQVQILREAATTEKVNGQQEAMQQLQVEHAATLKRKESSIRLDIDNLKNDHVKALESREADHKSAMEKLTGEHTSSLEKLERERKQEVDALKLSLDQSRQEQEELALQLAQDLSRAKAEFVAIKDKLVADHEQTMTTLKAQHQESVTALQASLATAQEAHQAALEEARAEHSKFLESERQRHSEGLAELDQMHSTERETLRKAHDAVVEELTSSKSAVSVVTTELEQSRTSHQANIEDYKSKLAKLEDHLASVIAERSTLASQAESLKMELGDTKAQQSQLTEETSKRESLEQELEQQRTLFTEVQADLQKSMDEKEALHAEKTKQDNLIRELQAQLAVKEKAHKRDGSGDSAPHNPRALSLVRVNGLPPAKLPPLTPPPAVPPPPLPSSIPAVPTDISTSSHASAGRESTSSQNSHRAESPVEHSTPSTSVIASPVPPVNATLDSKVTTLIEEQARHLDEQEAMIKTLNKQLTHCESDLQAHMDLVATLEASLTDSERNLRKARLQSNELAKERDSYQQQSSGLRTQLAEAQREVTNVRRSVVEEKQSLERSLEEERKAKERARAQLDSRMEELTKRKSKFVCL